MCALSSLVIRCTSYYCYYYTYHYYYYYYCTFLFAFFFCIHASTCYTHHELHTVCYTPCVTQVVL